jgi:hypothetical protein
LVVRGDGKRSQGRAVELVETDHGTGAVTGGASLYLERGKVPEGAGEAEFRLDGTARNVQVVDSAEESKAAGGESLAIPDGDFCGGGD